MKFETTRFGSIEVGADEIFIFPEGPLGFPECTRFTFIKEEGTEPFMMMQSLDNPSLAFVVVDPMVVRSDYTFDVTKDELALLKADSLDGLLVYAIVTMANELQNVTVNLQGPLILSPSTRLGFQYVLLDSEFTTRERLLQEVDAEDILLEDEDSDDIKRAV